jgi:KaiC/GvpD/RAD55 family RecA-like ATPase
MKKKIQLLSSGISLVDSAWGGLYRGGTYLLIGAHKSGRTLLALKYAMECSVQKEICLYFTTKRPKDLIIMAASINFDLQSYMDKNLVIVIRVSAPGDILSVPDPDQQLIEYLTNIISIVDQYQPSKIVFDELTPYIEFNNLNLLKESFVKTIEAIEDFGTTSLFVLNEPATLLTEKIITVLTDNSTGIIFLKKNDDPAKQFYGGTMIITPNIGHTQGKFSSEYIIEPNKGITTTPASPGPGVSVAPVSKERSYKPLDANTSNEAITHSNFYEKSDFFLLLNNQIALYKSTGQIFSLLSFRLDAEAERKGLLTVSQLQNAVRLSTDRKDKICIITNNVVVLITREENPKSIKNLIAKIKTNLPSTDPGYIKSVVPYISVYSVQVNENVQNAGDLLKLLVTEEQKDKIKVNL